jgi:hypothetical protein
MTDAALGVSQSEACVQSVEVSVRGKWVRVPAAHINGQTIIVRGRLIKIASLHDEDWTATRVTDPADCIQALKVEHTELGADIFFFSQNEADNQPYYDYPMEMRSLAVTDTTSPEAWWRKVSHGTRSNIKQSKKRGIEIRSAEFNDDLVLGIMGIQNENPIRQGRRFYHYGKTFDEAKRDHGSYLDSCDFICAYHGQEMLGFLKMVYRGNVASIMQINSKLAHQYLRPTNALLQKAVEVCAFKGIQHLIYGEFNYWNKRESTLRDFKVHNGFKEMLVPTYYVPLTAWGSLCVKLRLYRGIFGLLPTGAINSGLEMRRKWYQFKTNLGKMSVPRT